MTSLLKRLVRRGRADQPGQSAVETAAILPVVLALIVGSIAAARYFYVQAAITTAVGDCGTVLSAMGPADASGSIAVSVMESTLSGFGIGEPTYSWATRSTAEMQCHAVWTGDDEWTEEEEYQSYFVRQCWRSDWNGGLIVADDPNPDCLGTGR
jgi:Flp pilus assembly protein TadG